ncbi:unnamed protein product [Caenorhabditis auriculariae]|uniref:CRAL-TRIO domain-containing protein n=1 Tax=Caenorhabditis auriculariae TaxID=2777116 RepID=A0A8S1HCY4_9PELO|nr:unnamed protein product [Caenorhabditis auriculariae]
MTKKEISDEDRGKINKLRELVKADLTSYYDTDFNILRWLQGHSSTSLEDIAKKLTHHLKLRKSTWQLDELHKAERNQKIHHHWKYGITGESKVLENCIVNVEQCGKTDYSGMMESFSISDVMKARMVDLEQMLNQVMKKEEETGKQAWILYVMDVSGLEFNKKLYELVTGSMRALAEFMAEHYVEMIKFFVPVCVPNFACKLYVLVRPLLPEKTKDKVRLIAESNWRDTILEYADVDSLPSIWNDENHQFFSKLELPVPYPIDGYYSAKKEVIPENAERINVVAGKVHVSKIFRDRNYGFGCFTSEKEDVQDYYLADQVTPMFPWMPITLVPLNDSIAVKKNAYYHLWVSNQRAWWFPLTVTLSISVEENEAEEAV